jgi:hypothetical protein
MECFDAMFTNSEEHGLFLQLGSPAIKHCISLYADDVVAFVSSVEQDLILVKAILDTFFKATSLAANYIKSQAFPIRCEEEHTNLLTVYFGAPSMFITLWFGFDYGTNPPLGTLII